MALHKLIKKGATAKDIVNLIEQNRDNKTIGTDYNTFINGTSVHKNLLFAAIAAHRGDVVKILLSVGAAIDVHHMCNSTFLIAPLVL